MQVEKIKHELNASLYKKTNAERQTSEIMWTFIAQKLTHEVVFHWSSQIPEIQITK